MLKLSTSKRISRPEKKDLSLISKVEKEFQWLVDFSVHAKAVEMYAKRKRGASL